MPLLCSLLLQGCDSALTLNAFEEETPSKQSLLRGIQGSSPASTGQTGAIIQRPQRKYEQETQAQHKGQKENLGVLTSNVQGGQQRISQKSYDTLVVQLSHESAQCRKLQREQVVLREAYEQQLCSLEQAKEDAQKAKEDAQKESKLLREENCALLGANRCLRVRLGEMESLQQVSKRKRETKKPPSQKSVHEIAFGKEQWARYFGDVGEEPPLPTHIDAILDRSCPFWPGKQVRDTHLLVLLPSKVNARSLTLNSLGELVRCSHSREHGTRFHNYDEVVKRLLGYQSLPSSYWVLITRDVVPTNHYRIATNQIVSMTGKAYQSGYTASSALEAATAILSHYIHTGEVLYPESSRTYALCQDFSGPQSHVLVGGLSVAGLNLFDSQSTEVALRGFNAGVACTLRL